MKNLREVIFSIILESKVADIKRQNPELEKKIDEFVKLLPEKFRTNSCLGSSNVRNCLASNIKTPPDVLRKYVRTGNSRLIIDVCNNPSAPPDIVRKMADSKNIEIRSVIASSSATPQDVLEKLSHDRSRRVLHRLAYNPKIDHKLQVLFSQSKDQDLRYSLINNPSIEYDVLQKLANDPVGLVARHAREKLIIRQNHVTEALRSFLRLILEDPRTDPLVTAIGQETRGPCAGDEPNMKGVLGRYDHEGDTDEDVDE